MSDRDLYVRCECGQVWSAVRLPAAIEVVALRLRELRCPACGGGADKIFQATPCDVVPVDLGPPGEAA
jgi:Zn finger protein HypA/HybF involved in hydrogenase expression